MSVDCKTDAWKQLSPKQRQLARQAAGPPPRRWNSIPITLPGLFLLGISGTLIALGARVEHEVCTLDAEENEELLGVLTFEKISDRQLTIDATFTGVESKDGHMYSRYDRSLPPQKRLCPT